MFANQLEERMLQYESCLSVILPPRLPYIIRVGGHCFSSFMSNLDDPKVSQLFKLTTQKMHENIQGCAVSHHHKDELCFLINNSKNENTQPWCGGDKSKIESLSASMATAFFMHYCQKQFPEAIESRVPIFKSKVFVVPDIQEAYRYLSWREHKMLEEDALEWFKQNIGKVQAKMLNSEQILSIVLADEQYSRKPDENKHGLLMIHQSGNWTMIDSILESSNGLFETISKLFEKEID